MFVTKLIDQGECRIKKYMKRILMVAVMSTLLSAEGLTQTTKIKSVYTDLSGKTCKKLKPDAENGVFYRAECPGTGGYKLIFLDGDLRQSLNLIAPDGRESRLDLWSKVTAPKYSFLGKTAEWRVTINGKSQSVGALIVRFNAYEDPTRFDKAESFLVVIKVAGPTACITDIVKPGKDQNLKAREFADVSADKPCRGEGGL